MKLKMNFMGKNLFKLILLLVFLTFLDSDLFAASTDVESFVTRFYQQCLSREPDIEGLNHWVDSLNDGDKAGDELAEAFVFSEEFQNQNTSDSEFVTVLYNAFFDREPDSSGYNHWMDQLADGMSRSFVLDGFTSAQEFVTLCENYGITASSWSSSSDTPVQGFVTRFYQQCLSREPDTEGLDHWTDSLSNGDQAGADLAEAFIFSEEFQNQNTSDSEFVTILYNAFFDREPDTSGYNHWMDQLADGMSRSSVLDEFTSAQEFIYLCQTYGITATCVNLNNTNFIVTEYINLESCGVSATEYKSVYVTQNGCLITIIDSGENFDTGTISGNVATIESTYYKDGGIIDVVYTLTFASDGSSFQGSGTGVWTDGFSTCFLTVSISGERYNQGPNDGYWFGGSANNTGVHFEVIGDKIYNFFCSMKKPLAYSGCNYVSDGQVIRLGETYPWMQYSTNSLDDAMQDIFIYGPISLDNHSKMIIEDSLSAFPPCTQGFTISGQFNGDIVINGTWEYWYDGESTSGQWNAQKKYKDSSETNIKNLHTASIKIDGEPSDWQGIQPMISDPESDEDTDADFIGTDIKYVYLVKDNEYLYMMITFHDDGPVMDKNLVYSFDFNKYPSLYRGPGDIELSITLYDAFSNPMTIDASKVDKDGYDWIHLADFKKGYVSIGEGLLEAMIPLTVINNLDGKYLNVNIQSHDRKNSDGSFSYPWSDYTDIIKINDPALNN